MTKLAVLAVLSIAALLVAGQSSAQAAPPSKDISSSGPLNHIYIGNELSCQISHTGDSSLELYPPSTIPGDCGTFLSVGGALYTPNFSTHDSSAASSRFPGATPFTPVSQTDVSGAGTSASPLKVVTVANAGATGLVLTETDTYVVGDETYDTKIVVANQGAATSNVILYRAGDCYLQESDVGFGFEVGGAVGCSKNANNSPPGRIEEWIPITSGSNYMEGGFSDVWAAIAAQTPFPNTTRSNESIDQGAGLSWSKSIAAGAEATFEHATTFSPTGGQPRSRDVIRMPSNRRCVSRRKFRVRIKQPGGIRIDSASVFVNRKRVRVVKRKVFSRTRSTAKVNLTGLPKGTFEVKIVVLTTTGTVIQSKRRYRTGTKKRRGSGGGRL